MCAALVGELMFSGRDRAAVASIDAGLGMIRLLPGDLARDGIDMKALS
jgi:hypothetical protein